MGMMFSKPKYTPPPQIEESRRAIEQRDASAAAAERKQLRELSARRRATRRSGILINEQNLDLLSGQEVPEVTVRDPMTRYR
jgi:hypothetical protein|tara:strand:+ start:76 stop:321 length:246 start_codon:yes stop_codon:yes gene_type:complete